MRGWGVEANSQTVIITVFWYDRKPILIVHLASYMCCVKQVLLMGTSAGEMFGKARL